MVEINPLITTVAGEVKAIDAKMSIDDSSLFRQPDIGPIPGPVGRALGGDQGARVRPQLREARRRRGLLP